MIFQRTGRYAYILVYIGMMSNISVIYNEWLTYLIKSSNILSTLTCAKIDDNINKKYGIWKAVEGDPTRTQVIVEERYSNGKNN